MMAARAWAPRAYYTSRVVPRVSLPAGVPALLRSLWEAAVATLLTFVLMRYLVFEFVSSYPIFFGEEPRARLVERLSSFSLDAVAALLLLVFVARGSSRSARRYPQRPVLVGSLVALTSVALFHAAIGLWFPPVDPAEVALHLPAALLGGLLGAAHGRRARERADAAYRARVGIARSRRPHDVVAAIGENLPGSGAVLLWRVPFEPAAELAEDPGLAYELAAAWPDRQDGRWPLGERLAGEDALAAASLPPGRLSRRPLRALPEPVRGALAPMRAVLMAPLSAAGEPLGLLVVALQRSPRWARHPYVRTLQLAAQQLAIFRKEEIAQWAGVHDERERLADEIHDTIIQGCIAVGNRIEDIADTERLAPEDRENLARALKVSRETVAEARLFIRALNTDDFSRDLPALLSEEAEGFREQTGIRAQTTTTGTPFPLPPKVGMALFKAAREGLANVARHAHASTVHLVLAYDGARRVSLRLSDDGVGPNGIIADGAAPAAQPNHQTRLASGGHGLRAIRRLVRNAGGALSVEGSPTGGTTLSVRFDLARRAEDPDPSVPTPAERPAR